MPISIQASLGRLGFVAMRPSRLHFCVYGLFAWGSTAVIVTATE
jgi:hypothetical protein